MYGKYYDQAIYFYTTFARFHSIITHCEAGIIITQIMCVCVLSGLVRFSFLRDVVSIFKIRCINLHLSIPSPSYHGVWMFSIQRTNFSIFLFMALWRFQYFFIRTSFAHLHMKFFLFSIYFKNIVFHKIFIQATTCGNGIAY
jgi:hypothetical protein